MKDAIHKEGADMDDLIASYTALVNTITNTAAWWCKCGHDGSTVTGKDREDMDRKLRAAFRKHTREAHKTKRGVLP